MRFQTANKAEETPVAPKSGFAEKPSRRARGGMAFIGVHGEAILSQE